MRREYLIAFGLPFALFLESYVPSLQTFGSSRSPLDSFRDLKSLWVPFKNLQVPLVPLETPLGDHLGPLRSDRVQLGPIGSN